MLETPQESAERIWSQMRFRPDAAIYYIAWGSSRKFIAFTKGDHAFIQYSDDPSRLLGAYRRNSPIEFIEEDIIHFLTAKGLLC